MAARLLAADFKKKPHAMKKIFALFVSSLAALAGVAGSASAWCGDCCCSSKCCATICLRPYNAFTPVCCGSLCVDGCASMMFGGMYMGHPCYAGMHGLPGYPYPGMYPMAGTIPGTVAPRTTPPPAATPATPPAFKAPTPTPNPMTGSAQPEAGPVGQAVPYPMAYGPVQYAGYSYYPGYGMMPYYWNGPVVPAGR